MLTKPRASHLIADVRAHGAPLHLSHSKTPPDLRMLHSHPSPQPLGLCYWLLPHTPVPLRSLLAAHRNPAPRENISSGQKWLVSGAPAFPPAPPRHIPGATFLPWSLKAEVTLRASTVQDPHLLPLCLWLALHPPGAIRRIITKGGEQQMESFKQLSQWLFLEQSLFTDFLIELLFHFFFF